MKNLNFVVLKNTILVQVLSAVCSVGAAFAADAERPVPREIVAYQVVESFDLAYRNTSALFGVAITEGQPLLPNSYYDLDELYNLAHEQKIDPIVGVQTLVEMVDAYLLIGKPLLLILQGESLLAACAQNLELFDQASLANNLAINFRECRSEVLASYPLIEALSYDPDILCIGNQGEYFVEMSEDVKEFYISSKKNVKMKIDQFVFEYIEGYRKAKHNKSLGGDIGEFKTRCFEGLRVLFKIDGETPEGKMRLVLLSDTDKRAQVKQDRAIEKQKKTLKDAKKAKKAE